MTSRPARSAERPIVLDVDASDIARQIVHSRLTIDAPAGPLTLAYPKWIPGTHRPYGAIENLTGITMTKAGRPVEWVRDTLDYFTFHCQVPAGAGPLSVGLDYVLANASHAIATLNWFQVVLYPLGRPVDQIPIEAHLTLPAGWTSACALEVARRRGATLDYSPTDLMTVVDSPVLMGAHFRAIPLSSDGEQREELDLACDSDEGLELGPALLESFQRLPKEMHALFGPGHYRHYQFLTGLSDHVPGAGVEHHQSTDIRQKERSLIEREQLSAHVNVFPHEMVHSWNGKYRRPLGLAFTDYQHPENAELLWVYEGLTQYLGLVLAGRSGLQNLENARMSFATTAASLSVTPGRKWKNVRDTAIESGPLRGAPAGWSSWRRGQDYYGEGALIWLEADATIRRLSGDRHSLDDFCRSFFGGADSGPEVRPYLEADVIAALDAVQPYDWRRFFDERVNGLDTPTPTRALAAAGWKLAWADSLSPYEKASQMSNETRNLIGSLGIRLDNNAVMTDVLPGLPAAKSGLGPGMTLLGVNGRKYTFDVLKDALKRGRSSAAKLELLVNDGDFYRTVQVDYHGGLRYAALERIAGQPDYLSEILGPKVARPATR